MSLHSAVAGGAGNCSSQANASIAGRMYTSHLPCTYTTVHTASPVTATACGRELASWGIKKNFHVRSLLGAAGSPPGGTRGSSLMQSGFSLRLLGW